MAATRGGIGQGRWPELTGCITWGYCSIAILVRGPESWNLECTCERCGCSAKRWGKRFRSVLAEIAGREFGGPPHRTPDFFVLRRNSDQSNNGSLSGVIDFRANCHDCRHHPCLRRWNVTARHKCHICADQGFYSEGRSILCVRGLFFPATRSATCVRGDTR